MASNPSLWSGADAVSYTHLPDAYKELVGKYFPDAGENPDAKSATVYKPEQTWNYEIGSLVLAIFLIQSVAGFFFAIVLPHHKSHR